MGVQRLSGKDFHTTVGNRLIKMDSSSISISDNRTTVYTQGVPNGYVDGDVSASGDFTVDSQNFNHIVEAAKSAGSFKALEPFDVMFFAQTSGGRLKVEAFGCLLKVSDLLSIDTKGGDKTTHKIDFEVTDSDFIKINGVPYLEAAELIGVL